MYYLFFLFYNMLKKISLMLVIFIILYLLLVFKTPNEADTLWNKELNNLIRGFKSNLDKWSTNIPTKDEFWNTISNTFSWAIKLKDDIASWIKNTKDTIDSVRATLSWAENTYNEAKDKIDEVKTFIDESGNKIDQVKDTLNDLEKIADWIKWAVNTWAIN